MASTATERASEIVDNFSHSGMRNCNAEIILQSGSGSASSWYNQFYNSSGHRANMMDDLWGSAAAAYCKVGNKYYVIVMFDLQVVTEKRLWKISIFQSLFVMMVEVN